MTKFPDRIEITLQNRKTREPVQNVIGLITLFANHKNNYNLYTPLSDNNGIITFTKDWLEKQIYLEASTAIMDYASGLEDCKPKIEFKIETEDVIRTAVESLKVWAAIITEYQEDLDNLLLARNCEFQPCTNLILINQNDQLQKEIIYLEKL